MPHAHGSLTSALVTGGAGYIGSHTCKVLAGDGYWPVVFDSLVRGNAEAVRWGPLIRGDLGDRDAIVRALRESGADTVLHFAAYAYVGESMGQPGGYFRNNVANTLNLLEAMVEAGVKRIVFSSSCATYGIPEELPIREDTPQQPVNPYGETKLLCERLIRWYGEIHGIEWVALRYFNAAGADPDGEIGECHDPEPHLIPIVLDAMRAGRPVHILGGDYATPDGTAVRDYVHVSDLARAHVLAVEYLAAGGESVALNLATGVGTSVREVVRAAERVTGRNVPVEVCARREGDPPVLSSVADKARQVLGWVPEYPDVEDMIRHAWTWRTGTGASGRTA